MITESEVCGLGAMQFVLFSLGGERETPDAFELCVIPLRLQVLRPFVTVCPC
jgi:hypothetical protein